MSELDGVAEFLHGDADGVQTIGQVDRAGIVDRGLERPAARGRSSRPIAQRHPRRRGRLRAGTSSSFASCPAIFAELRRDAAESRRRAASRAARSRAARSSLGDRPTPRGSATPRSKRPDCCSSSSAMSRTSSSRTGPRRSVTLRSRRPSSARHVAVELEHRQHLPQPSRRDAGAMERAVVALPRRRVTSV